MNKFLVIKSKDFPISDIKNIEIVRILVAEDMESAKDEFLVWLSSCDLPKDSNHYFLVETISAGTVENAAFLLKIRQDSWGLRGRPTI